MDIKIPIISRISPIRLNDIVRILLAMVFLLWYIIIRKIEEIPSPSHPNMEVFRSLLHERISMEIRKAVISIEYFFLL